MTHPPPSSPLNRLPPPLGFVGAFLIGMLLQYWAWPHGPISSAPLITLAVGLVAIGAATALNAIVLFVTSRTTVVPHGQSAHFVVGGPYRWTRNPMYLGLVLAYAGAAVWTGTWLALPLLALPILHLSRWVIPMEEGALHSRFGQPYEDYSRRVRRWL